MTIPGEGNDILKYIGIGIGGVIFIVLLILVVIGIRRCYRKRQTKADRGDK